MNKVILIIGSSIAAFGLFGIGYLTFRKLNTKKKQIKNCAECLDISHKEAAQRIKKAVKMAKEGKTAEEIADITKVLIEFE